MYYAYKCLKNDYSIGYYKDDYIIHSHRLPFKTVYERYKLIGKFFYENKEIDDLIQNNIKYLKTVIFIMKRFDLISLFKLPFNVLARLLGMRKGRKLARKEHKKCLQNQ